MDRRPALPFPGSTGSALVPILAAAGVAGCFAAPLPPTVASTGQGPVSIVLQGFPARELSGLAWRGGTSDGSEYLAVGDDGFAGLWKLELVVDRLSGQVTVAQVVGSLAVPGLAVDAEGIVAMPGRATVLVADEAASAIREFRLEDATLVGPVAVPPIYAAPNLRPNLGLESLGARDGALWTSNEEALVSDGGISTVSMGTLVRIQRFSAQLQATGQWAYRTDPISAMTPLVDLERSGVVDVVPVGPSQVLVLEREFGGPLVPDFRSRIYHVDVDGADDVSARRSLAKGGFVPVAKTLLWQGDFPFVNFEGMTIGPMLADGCRALLLVADDGAGSGGQQARILALRLCGVTACDADLDGSGAVEATDLAALLAAWATTGSPADLDGDGAVAAGDLAMLLASWGSCGAR